MEKGAATATVCPLASHSEMARCPATNALSRTEHLGIFKWPVLRKEDGYCKDCSLPHRPRNHRMPVGQRAGEKQLPGQTTVLLCPVASAAVQRGAPLLFPGFMDAHMSAYKGGAKHSLCPGASANLGLPLPLIFCCTAEGNSRQGLRSGGVQDLVQHPK